MSDISFSCPQCDSEVTADSQFAGDTAQCPSCNAVLLVPMPGIKADMYLGDFKIIKRLGLGGMGEVWLADQEALRRKVALKILAPHLTKDSDFVNRFLQEVQLAGKLTHPNIVTAFHAGEDKGIYYLAMEFIDGAELENKLLIDKVINEQEALKVVRDIAVALDYAWDKFQILHRDIKPSNIMLSEDGDALLMDMGISKSLIEDNSLTMAGEIIGTPYYMSPEQAQSESTLDFRADLYSLGATLFHITTGKTPYDSDSAVGILTQHITAPLPDPMKANSDLSAQCSELIRIMMEKNRDDRQGSWKELIEDIDLVINKKFPKKSNRSIMSSTLQKIDKTYLSSEAKPLNRVALIGTLILMVTSLVAVSLLLKPDDDETINDLEVQQQDKIETVVEDVDPTEQVVKKEPLVTQPEINLNQLKFQLNLENNRANQEKLWQSAIEYDDNHMGEYDQVIARYKFVKERLGGTEFEAKAEGKIKNLYNQKEADITQLMNELEERAKEFVDAGNYKRAASFYKNYDQSLARETEKRRSDLAFHYLSLVNSTRDTNTTPENNLPDSNNESVTMLKVCDSLIKRKYQDAYDLFDESGMSAAMPDVLKSLDELKDFNNILVKALNKHKEIKSTVSLTINKSRETGTIKYVDSKTLKLLVKKKKASFPIAVKVNSILTIEKLKLIKGSVSETTRRIFYANYLRFRKDHDKANKEYTKTGVFAPYFEVVLNPISEAEKGFEYIIHELNYNMDSAERIDDSFLEENYDLVLIEELYSQTKKWAAEFKNSNFFKENKKTIGNWDDSLFAYYTIKTDERMRDMHHGLELNTRQVIEFYDVFNAQLDPWDRKDKIQKILTPSQRNKWFELRDSHELRPNKNFDNDRGRPMNERFNDRPF